MLGMMMRSEAGAKVMGVALFKDNLHLREIARRAGVTAPEAKRELGLLARLGVLKQERRGNQLLFSVNQACPFLKELRALYLKTDGVFALLGRELAKVNGVKYAFVYGSMARGDFGERSDVDVMVVGSAEEEAVAAGCTKAGKITERPINFILWSERDLAQKLKERAPFALAILKGKKAWLAGDSGEFGRTVEKARG